MRPVYLSVYLWVLHRWVNVWFYFRFSNLKWNGALFLRQDDSRTIISFISLPLYKRRRDENTSEWIKLKMKTTKTHAHIWINTIFCMIFSFESNFPWFLCSFSFCTLFRTHSISDYFYCCREPSRAALNPVFCVQSERMCFPHMKIPKCKLYIGLSSHK